MLGLSLRMMMSAQQSVLSLVLATMVFSVALNLRIDDFYRVARSPRAVLGGLIPQFILLPWATWLATLLLDLPPNIEVAMILVAACPGAASSNVVTQYGQGNVALSVSLTAVTGLLTPLTMPLYVGLMVASNPDTAAWLRELAIDTSGIWRNLLLLLAAPLGLGLFCAHQLPRLTHRIRKPLGKLAMLALLLFIVAAVVAQRQLLTPALLPLFLLVVLHNAGGLLLGWLTGNALRVSEPDKRAITVEAGMQSSGIALGIIAMEFNGDLGMVTVAGLWGIWHLISALALARYWRRRNALRAAAHPT